MTKQPSFVSLLSSFALTGKNHCCQHRRRGVPHLLWWCLLLTLVIVTTAACVLHFKAVPATNEELFRNGTCAALRTSHDSSSAATVECTTAKSTRILRSLNQHNLANGGNKPRLEYIMPQPCTHCSPILRAGVQKHLSKAAHKHMSDIQAKIHAHTQRSRGQNAKLKATAVDQKRAINTLTSRYPNNPTKFQLQQEVHTVDGDIMNIKQRLRKLERFERNSNR
jgi:hypothetical protein